MEFSTLVPSLRSGRRIASRIPPGHVQGPIAKLYVCSLLVFAAPISKLQFTCFRCQNPSQSTKLIQKYSPEPLKLSRNASQNLPNREKIQLAPRKREKCKKKRSPSISPTLLSHILPILGVILSSNLPKTFPQTSPNPPKTVPKPSKIKGKLNCSHENEKSI